jgi:hypothetical protein
VTKIGVAPETRYGAGGGGGGGGSDGTSGNEPDYWVRISVARGRNPIRWVFNRFRRRSRKDWVTITLPNVPSEPIEQVFRLWDEEGDDCEEGEV